MQVKDLLVTGNVRVLGNLYTKDGPVGGGSSGGGAGGGDSITYRLTKSGSTITLSGSDGSSSSVTDADTNTTYTLSSLGAAPASHTHDDRYYTESEVNNLINGRAPSSHTHDDRYYTEGEVNNLINGRAPAYQYSATDLTAGSSSLATGTLYFVYV